MQGLRFTKSYCSTFSVIKFISPLQTTPETLVIRDCKKEAYNVISEISSANEGDDKLKPLIKIPKQ